MKSETKIHIQKLLDILSTLELSPEQQQAVDEATAHFDEQKQHFTVLTLHRDNLFDQEYLSHHLSDEQMEKIAANIRHECHKTNFWDMMSSEAGEAGVPHLFDSQPLLLTSASEVRQIDPEDGTAFTVEEVRQLLVADKPAIVAVSDFNDVAFIAVPDGRAFGLARNDAASEICRCRDVSLMRSTATDICGNMLICPKKYLSDQAWHALIAIV